MPITLNSWRVLVAGGLCAALAGGCGGEGDAGGEPNAAFTVMADDGSATLEIPEGALPPGTDPATVTLTALDPAEAAVTAEGFEVALVYQLEPDGLQLSSPATLRHAPPQSEGNTLYLAVHISDGNLDLPQVDWEMPETTDGPPTLEASLDHFSSYAFLKAVGVGRVEFELDANDTIVDSTTAAGVVRADLIADTVVVKLDSENTPPIVVNITSSRFLPTALIASSNLSPRGYLLAEGGVFLCLRSGPMTFDVSGSFLVTGSAYQDGTRLRDFDDESLLAWQDSVIRICAEDIYDATDDYIDSIMSAPVMYRTPLADIAGFGAERDSFTQGAADKTFNNSILECDVATESGVLTVCPEDVADFPAGDFYVVSTTIAESLPAAGADEGHHFIYAAVFDSDGVSENNWQFVEPYDWDYFQGADRWYQLSWNPDTASWSLTVSQVDASQQVATVASSVRATVHDKTITWFIPAAELPAAQPGFRVTAFGHDGNYSPDDRGGDVSGANPTEPLTPLPTEP